MFSHHKKFIAVSLLMFTLGFVSVLGYRIYQTKKFKQISFFPQISDFKLQPPTLALTGNVEQINGEVKKRGREDKDFREIKTGEKIIQGEVLNTGEKARVDINFPGFVKLKIQPNSEIGFNDLIAEKFLISLKNGNLNYEITTDKSISVRSLHLLSTYMTGYGKINTNQDAGLINIEVASGSAKLALVDQENNTQVVELNAGQKVEVDDTQRTVQIL